MQTIPNSTLYLCKDVDLDPNYNYTIDFDNITAQANYFDSKIATEFEINEGYSYVRDTQALKIQANIDDLLGINYLFYNNGNKRYYAFITKKEYISSTCTSLSFKLDVLQSFMFDYEIDESFVEREHQNRWQLFNNIYKPIYNLEAENLDIGKNYKCKQTTKVTNKGFYIIKAKEPLGDIYTSNNWNSDASDFTKTGGGNSAMSTGIYVYMIPSITNYSINRITAHYSSMGVNYLENPSGSSITYDMASLKDFIDNPNVISIQYINLLNNDIVNYELSGTRYNLTIGASLGNKSFGYIARVGQDNKKLMFRLLELYNEQYSYNLTEDIAPINLNINSQPNIANEPKLLTSPYSYFDISLFGENMQLYRELFSTSGSYNLDIYSSPNINNTISVVPRNYAGAQKSHFHKKTLGSANELDLRTDKWQSYILNNKATVNGSMIVAGAQTLANVGAGLLIGGLGLAGGLISGVNFAGQIANNLLQKEDLKQAPDDLRNVSNDINSQYLMDTLNLTINTMELLDTFKIKIFNYFNHYGYKCNDFKKPNIRSRYYFNYIKTIGANIKTNIDADFRAEIENAYNNGLTIWHYRNATTFKGVNNFDYENVELNLMEV